MIVYTLNHPVLNGLIRKLTKKKWRIELLTEKWLQDILHNKSSHPAPSLFLLPLYYEEENAFLSQIIEYADHAHIPILFILNSKKQNQWCLPLPSKTIYDTLNFPIKEKDIAIKVQNLQNSNIKLLSAMLREDEFEDIKKRMNEDLYLAKTVQNLVLPQALYQENISLESVFEPSSQLSGDLFFWLEISKNKYGIIIMDVNGHGVHAALISMSMRSLLQGLMKKVQDPVLITNELNQHMTKLFKEFHLKSKYTVPYFTALIAYIDTEAKSITYVNAGHPPGMIYQPGTEKIKLLSKGSMPIGLIPKLPIEGEKFFYEPNSKLLLFTDGLIEAPGHSDVMLLDIIEDTFIKGSRTQAPDILNYILLSRMKHSEINDDICIIHGILK